ncbi:hypothetical protein TIFTF001_001295 [Ficus carica]|uniref:Serpin domain-containing protein n=1 Tax=Ficus carica TaxID=3494 RepID=A0AA87ZF60_FICCA|nr:hypothetical protein TIFTF001_001295 [Ficus carica]
MFSVTPKNPDQELWGDKATKGLIKKFLEYNENRKQTALILANALYFKAAWWDRFDEKETRSGSFYTLNGDILQVAFMCKQYDDYCLYASSKGFKVLRLPYSDYPLESSFSMYIFLPDEKDGMLNLLDQFSSNPADLFNPQFEFEHGQIRELMIPKFKFKSKFNISKNMERLGLTMSSDDFSEMVEALDHKNVPMYDMNIFQTCSIEV